MYENVRCLKLLHFEESTISGLCELQQLLASWDIDAQLIPFDTWINNKTNHKADAFIVAADPSYCTSHAIYSILDLGKPALILKCFEGHHYPSELPTDCNVNNMQETKEYLLDFLEKSPLKSTYLPLSVPSARSMEKLNSLSIYGVSASFLDVIAELYQFSRSQAPLLVQGETGTGKELAARALHYLGPRCEGPFIPVNCSSLPDGVFENEVFGHSRGAYTDAKNNYAGLVAQAQNGTLFLDEVDSLQPRAQASLLRYLQDKKYRPLGSTKFVYGQTSIVAATNQYLEALVREGKFRQDLLYRINAITITLPPLRKRPEDIRLLARIFLRRLCEQYGQPPKSFHPDTLKWLELQHWPGNVRQLENRIHREFLLSESSFIDINAGRNTDSASDQSYVHLPLPISDYRFNRVRDIVLRDFEQQFLHRLMVATHGNVTQAAHLAEKERRCLGKLLKKHNINREDYLRQ